ncbi:NUDIX domain-containing protein [Thiomicrorhabdus sp. Milos-T2]|uniref:NUDIX domain-containing protein n=1 Tax=Thiomicrorhabdus sp. Milos-T2 TaxID=90814 RepID=UPI000493DCE5|nr:NUDIX domain-containing protein [Thiomicrorhabdus sp. Milos-T2]
MDKTLLLDSNRMLFKGFFQVNLLEFSHSLYQGGSSPIVKREVFKRGEAVVVLLYDLSLEQVVLVEQCRAGAVEKALKNNDIDQAWLLEPVAGMIDSGETKEQACIRECQEETGIMVSNLEYISQFYPSPGGCDEVLYLFASDIDSSDTHSHAGLASEDEDIRIVKLSFKDAKQQLTTGQFNVVSTYVALQWLFYQKLPGLVE